MTERNVQTVTGHLDSLGVPHELIEHEETFTAVAEAAAAGVEPAMGGKTLLLHDTGGYRLVVLPAHRHLDLHRVRDLLGASRRLRLATEEEMARDFPSYEVGALPPVGPLLPSAEIVDIRLLDSERALFAAGDHRHSVLIPIRQLLRVTEPRVADVCEVRDDIEDW
jgi:Ala-tRNA(Pro) deacylase